MKHTLKIIVQGMNKELNILVIGSTNKRSLFVCLLFWSHNFQVNWFCISYAELETMLKIQQTSPLKQDVIKVFA